MKFPPGYVPGSGVHKASGFGGFGERLLRKQGWEKGEGLGKNKTGVAEAIQVKKKENTAGVGANRSHINCDKWWEGAFNAAVHTIDHEDSDSDSDSDVSTADEVTVAVRNNDGTLSSAAQHELQIAADLAAQPAWFGGGRFGGREGKLARIRQQEALAAAKLGLACAKAELAPAVTAVTVSKKRKTPSKTVLDTQAAAQPSAESALVTVTAKKAKGYKKQKQAGTSAEAASAAAEAADEVHVVTKKRIVVEPVFTATLPAVPFVQTPSAGWWGAKKFKSAGCLEGIDQQQNKAQSERQQFDEDDQANLYMAAQNLKTSGKKGLGTKSHIGKVTGAKWEGSRTVFDEDANDASQDPGPQSAASRHDAALASLPQAVSQDQPDHVSESQEDLPKMKWKKMALAELQKADQKQMKLKVLQKLLVSKGLAKVDQASSKHAQLMKDGLFKALSSSSQFVIQGKVVSLSA
ncbi:hypothetical protein WJX77_000660 [Trebouxia sp. C0004]